MRTLRNGLQAVKELISDPPLSYADSSLLRDPKVVQFLAQQESNTCVFFPEKAEQKAQRILNVMKKYGERPWPGRIMQYMTREEPLIAPHFAWKALNHLPTAQAILQAKIKVAGQEVRSKVDIASRQEGMLCLQGLGLAPDQLAHSNVWAGEEELRGLVQMGIRSFVAHNENTCIWLRRANQEICPNEKVRVTLRVGLEGHNMADKFGMPIADLPRMARYAKETGNYTDGVALHVGGFSLPDITSLDPHTRRAEMWRNFNKYGDAIRSVAEICTYLYKTGFIGRVVNLEGGLKVTRIDPEYSYEGVMLSQAEALKSFGYIPIWKNELGRVFGDCGIGVLKITNMDEKPRFGEDSYIVVDSCQYTGVHDPRWHPINIVKLDDVKGGRVYTVQEHPQMFERNILAGMACAGSDQFNYQGNDGPSVPLPKDLKPGDTLLAFPFGVYTSGALSPQTGLEMDGFFGSTHGFNGVPFMRNVTYTGHLA